MDWTPDRERNTGPCECVREILLMAGNERDFGEAADKSRRKGERGGGRTRDKDKIWGRKGEKVRGSGRQLVL